jgi:hypothetical protein
MLYSTQKIQPNSNAPKKAAPHIPVFQTDAPFDMEKLHKKAAYIMLQQRYHILVSRQMLSKLG